MSLLLSDGINALLSGQKAKALAIIKSIVVQDPKNPEAWFWLAEALDDNQKKIECYQRVLRLDPNHSHARSNLLKLEPQPTPSQTQAAPPPGATRSTDNNRQSEPVAREQFLAPVTGAVNPNIVKPQVIQPAPTLTFSDSPPPAPLSSDSQHKPVNIRPFLGLMILIAFLIGGYYIYQQINADPDWCRLVDCSSTVIRYTSHCPISPSMAANGIEKLYILHVDLITPSGEVGRQSSLMIYQNMNGWNMGGEYYNEPDVSCAELR